jgi:hypothetical protein
MGFRIVKTEIFRAICIKVADEKDPKKLELLKERLRLLLSEEPSDPPAKAELRPN